MIVMLGLGNYEAQPMRDAEVSSQRIYCTGADRIERTAFVRRAIEEWKVSGGNIADLVVSPPAISEGSQRWATYVKGKGSFLNLATLAARALGDETVRWSWDCNRQRDTPVTFTGIRTPPAMWVNTLNETPTSFPTGTELYKRYTTPRVWYTGLRLQHGKARQDMTMQKLVSRLNWRQVRGRLSNMGWPFREENRKLCYLLESFTQVDLFRRTGWAQGLPPIPNNDADYVWGWGGGLACRDWERMTYRVFTIQDALFNKLIGGSCDMDLVYTPCQLTAPFQTTEDEYILGQEGISVSDFLGGASSLPNPPGVTKGATTSAGAIKDGAPKDGETGKTGPVKNEKNGLAAGSAVAPNGVGMTTEAQAATASAEGAGGLQGAAKTEDSAAGSKEK